MGRDSMLHPRFIQYTTTGITPLLCLWRTAELQEQEFDDHAKIFMFLFFFEEGLDSGRPKKG